MARWLRDSLTDYTVIGCGRGRDLDGEEMTIAFKRNAFSLLEMHTFWLSETPQTPGSCYPDQSSCPRVCTQAVLREDAGGRILRVLNTHLDHVGQEARRRGLEQILAYVHRPGIFADTPAVLCGDFNAEPGDEEMQPIRTDAFFRSVTEDIGPTYHGFGMAERPVLIDYILVSGALSCLNVSRWHIIENGVYLSDHDPVAAELGWA